MFLVNYGGMDLLEMANTRGKRPLPTCAYRSHSPRTARLAPERSTFSPSQLKGALLVDCHWHRFSGGYDILAFGSLIDPVPYCFDLSRIERSGGGHTGSVAFAHMIGWLDAY